MGRVHCCGRNFGSPSHPYAEKRLEFIHPKKRHSVVRPLWRDFEGGDPIARYCTEEPTIAKTGQVLGPTPGGRMKGGCVCGNAETRMT